MIDLTADSDDGSTGKTTSSSRNSLLSGPGLIRRRDHVGPRPAHHQEDDGKNDPAIRNHGSPRRRAQGSRGKHERRGDDEEAQVQARDGREPWKERSLNESLKKSLAKHKGADDNDDGDSDDGNGNGNSDCGDGDGDDDNEEEEAQEPQKERPPNKAQKKKLQKLKRKDRDGTTGQRRQKRPKRF